MSRFVSVALFATLVSLVTLAQADEKSPPLKDGDRIVFLGDSITQQGAGKTGYVTLIKTALAEKHKDKKIEVIGAGISGNKVPNLQGASTRT
ncbi:MAG: hypothetical protein QM811_12915 [Pirellulales bacterium]